MVNRFISEGTLSELARGHGLRRSRYRGVQSRERKSLLTTAAGIEVVAVLHTDSLLPLDEISSVDPNVLGSLSSAALKGLSPMVSFPLFVKIRSIFRLPHPFLQGQYVKLTSSPRKRQNGFISSRRLSNAKRTKRRTGTQRA